MSEDRCLPKCTGRETEVRGAREEGTGMQRTIGVAIAALLAVTSEGVFARSRPAHAQPAQGKGESAVPPTGATQEILEQARGYRSWQRFPRYAEEPVFSKGHEKTYVVAWYNDAAAPSAKASGQRFPDGSIIVKENRAKPDSEPSALTVMAKRGGAWHWIKATPDWKVLTAGGKPIAGQDVAACAGCHAAAESDMVFSR